MKRIFITAFLLLITSAVYATTTTDKISYGTSTSVTCTINSLANSQTVGRCATAVDNTTTLADDYLTSVSIYPGAGATGNDKAVYVYMTGSEDGTNFEQEVSTTSPSTDGSYVIATPTIFRGPIVIPIASAGIIHTKIFSVANMFGGVIPRKFSYIVVNFSGQTLNSTGNVITVTPITYTNS